MNAPVHGGQDATEGYDAEQIRRAISGIARVPRVDVLDNVDSTNAWMLEQSAQLPPQGRVCIARRQEAGRGRRGRSWLCRENDDLAMSFGCRFADTAASIDGLSLAVGVCCATALRTIGVRDVAVKWPNDLVIQGRKLAGILIQSVLRGGEVQGVVIGVGLNMSPLDHGERIGLYEGLETECAPRRNAIAAHLIRALAELMATWQHHGREPWLHRYADFDALRGKHVRISLGADTLNGVARGVTETGALCLQLEDGSMRSIHAGEASIGGYGAPP